MYIHEVTQNSDGEKHEKCTSPGNNTWKPTKSSYSDNGHIWNQSDTGQGGEIPGTPSEMHFTFLKIDGIL